MAGLNLVLAARLVLQHFHFLAAAVRNDLADNFCFGDVAARDQFLVVVADGDDVVKRHLAANFAFQALDLNGLARRDAVLLSSTANYGVHAASGSFWETSIIRGVSICVNGDSRAFSPAARECEVARASLLLYGTLLRWLRGCRLLPDTNADLHGSILREDYVAAAR